MDQLKDVLTSSDYGFNYSENDAKVILDRYYDTVNTHKNPQDGSISLTDSIFYRKLELSNLNSRISQLESQRLEVSDTERDKIDDQIMTLKRQD
jgi:hypothetical protein